MIFNDNPEPEEHFCIKCHYNYVDHAGELCEECEAEYYGELDDE